ncbi:MAG: hypothetical protein HRT87_01215 [Legionellales bacterium]|nr:hypothetical protein [Legionellales bacterium]
MSVNITTYPYRVINGNSATVSKWSSVHHPIKFGLKREDFQVTVTTQIIGGDANLHKVQVLGSSLTVDQFLAVGSNVYIETLNGKGSYAVTALVNGSDFFFVEEILGVNIAGSAFLNVHSRKNYFVKTNIYGVDANDNYILIGTSINKPAINGTLEVDISSFLKSKVGYSNGFKYLSLNEKDNNLGCRYNITISENWAGYEGSFSIMSRTELGYFTNSVKQIGDLYGSNMGEYVPFDNYETEDIRAKFLSDFESPTFFVGYPFSLSFISSDKLALDFINRNEQEIDVNGNNSAVATGTQLITSQGLGVNRLMLMGGYGATTKKVDVSLTSVAGLQFRVGVTDLFKTGLMAIKSGLPIISTDNVKVIEEPTITTGTFTEAFVESFV